MRFLVALALAWPATATAETKPQDPLAVEIARCSKILRNTESTDETWAQVKESTAPLLEEAEKALQAGRRLFALQRLASARVSLIGFVHTQERAAAQKDLRSFEAEWRRMGRTWKRDLGAPAPKSFDAIHPAAIRAFAETAVSQARWFYQASLEYGRSTEPKYGVFYLGAARAQLELAALARKLSVRSEPGPSLRPLDAELDRLEAELLALYRPPLSIEKHPEFIAANSVLKDARDLNAAGLRHGALLRYLQAALRTAQLRPAATTSTPDLTARLSTGKIDHSIGRLFLETAQADPNAAAAVMADVLPRYFKALEPTTPPLPNVAPRVTVTLVRWPFT